MTNDKRTNELKINKKLRHGQLKLKLLQVVSINWPIECRGTTWTLVNE